MKGGEKQSERKTQSVRETDRLTERYREKKAMQGKAKYTAD